MNRWLVKSEPSVYAWSQFCAEKRTFWNGVRNHQAAANLKAMRLGDHCFYYHSNEGKEIVGIAEVVKEYYPDHTDETGKFGMVDLAPVAALKRPVTLAEIKADETLSAMALVRQSRLSVMPIDPAHWDRVMLLAGGTQ
jgi:predicted RNA-binding protein with PUA-like domain